MQKNTSGAMSTERAHFNETMKPTRVRVEHYIGLLKNRFQFLKSLRFLLTEDTERMERILMHVTVCVVLHDFLIAENDEDNKHRSEEDDCESNTDADNELNYPVNDATNENERRSQLTDFLAQKHMQIACDFTFKHL